MSLLSKPPIPLCLAICLHSDLAILFWVLQKSIMSPKDPYDPRWEDASKVFDDGPNPTVTCRHCFHVWHNGANERLEKHMKRCKKLPEERKAFYKFAGARDERPKKQAKIASEVWQWTKEDQETADVELAEAIYSSGVPFAFVSPYSSYSVNILLTVSS